MIVGKYEFNTKEEATRAIESLSSTNENGDAIAHKHTIVELGNIRLVKGVYDEKDKEVTPPIMSDKYHVDVLWVDIKEEPSSFASVSIDLSNEGVHYFSGVSYVDNKF